jgi:hypothetical protein
VFRRTFAVVFWLPVVLVECSGPLATGLRGRYWEQQTDVVAEPPWDLAFASDLVAKERLLGLPAVLGGQRLSPARHHRRKPCSERL